MRFALFCLQSVVYGIGGSIDGCNGHVSFLFWRYPVIVAAVGVIGVFVYDELVYVVSVSGVGTRVACMVELGATVLASSRHRGQRC